MIFDSLKEALSSLDDFPSYDIDAFMRYYHISLHYTESLPDNINGYSIPLTRTMFINEKSKDQLFVKHHEFIHCLLDENAEPLIESQYMEGTRIEHRADVGALSMMIKEYVRYLDLKPSELNIMHFQQYYGLDDMYLYDIASAVEKLYGIRVDL